MLIRSVIDFLDKPTIRPIDDGYKMLKPINWIIMVLGFLIGCPSLVYGQPSHCTSQELIIFNCSIGKKIASVCASHSLSPQSGYLQYRFGVVGSPELIIPNRKIPPNHSVSGNTLTFAGGGGAYLRFIRKRYHYIVYTAIGRGWGEKSGVSVEKNGQRLSNFICRDQPISELGTDLWEQIGITKDTNDFDLP